MNNLYSSQLPVEVLKNSMRAIRELLNKEELKDHKLYCTLPSLLMEFIGIKYFQEGCSLIELNKTYLKSSEGIIRAVEEHLPPDVVSTYMKETNLRNAGDILTMVELVFILFALYGYHALGLEDRLSKDFNRMTNISKN